MNINKLIFKYVFEIISLLFIIFVTYPIWQVLGISKGSTIASTYEDFAFNYISMYVDKSANLENLYPVDDEDVDKSNYTSVNIVNNTDDDCGYKLVMAVDKVSTLDISYIKISIDNNIYFLKDLYLSENDYVVFYNLDESIVEKNTLKNKKINIWLDKDTTNEGQNKELAFNFNLVEI